ncbi:MAG: hypothetical protein NZ890_12670 [Myxococcota bacterium]|nr:hypothetical protein [Myxococcota bacterium]
MRCEQIARSAGASLSDQAPIIARLYLADDGNRLTITAGANHILFDEPRPSWSTQRLCEDAIRMVAMHYPRGSVQDFVAQQVMRDPALKALLTSAGQAQIAFHAVAETPIEELEEGSDRYVEIQKAISAAQDAYRRYASYGQTLPSPVLSTAGLGILVDPAFDGKVPIQSAGVILRVAAQPHQVTLLAIESNRGRTIVTFDETMRATVSPEFRPYLVGDQVDVAGVVKRRIKRRESEVIQTGSSSSTVLEAPGRPPGQTAPMGGCTKDTDCKGDRICEQGRCVSPRR